MAENEFRPGELFVYTRDGECEHMELGQVCRKVNDDTYACWYSTGDTTARTNVRNMRKLANAGWSHVERAGDDDCCEWELVEKGPMYSHFRCSKCLYDYYESNTDAGATNFDPKRCPECGRFVQ